MSAAPPQAIRIAVGGESTVSALVQAPSDARACLVLAHGAGAGMNHAFMAALAEGLAQRGIVTLRYQFPFMERGSRRTDPPALAHSAVRAAVAEAAARFGAMPLYAGGKSFGGRMSSQAQALAPLAQVRGLVFLGFPLHAEGAPSGVRAEHLQDVRVPMLFVQGTRDKLAEFPRIQAVAAALGERATLMRIEEADHSFHVLARSGRKDAQVLQEILDGAAAWMVMVA